METAKNTEALIAKVKVIAAGPEGDLLRRLVDILYERGTVPEEHDDEPLTPEDLEAIERGKEDVKHGRTISWEELKRKHSL